MIPTPPAYVTLCVRYRPEVNHVDLWMGRDDKPHRDYLAAFLPLVQPYLPAMLNRPMDGAFKSQLWGLLLVAGDVLKRRGMPPLMIHTVKAAND
jgi:hypothetical protein